MKKKNKKKLSTGLIVGIVIASVLIVAGIGVGVMVINGVFDSEDGYDLICPTNTIKRCYSSGECRCQNRGSSGDPTDYIDKKPVIYLYPEATSKISVILGAPEKLIASYPKYTDGWEVLAEPSGKLTDLNTGRELYSLYWEGKDGEAEIIDEGFVVKGTEVAEFLEEKLAVLGLNEREAEEFIIYWLPVMQENEYNYVRFATADEIEHYMPLEVTPRPDNMIRVLMITAKLEEPTDLREQVLDEAPIRDGFTVVEWGGSVVK